MKQYPTPKLKEYLDTVNQILFKIIQAFEFCDYFYKPINQAHFDFIINIGFFRFSNYSMFRICFVDLHKLLSKNNKNNKFNLHMLIDRLSTNGIYYNNKISQDLIDKWKQALNDDKGAIKEIKTTRDKIYSHTDEDYEKVIESSEITLDDLRRIIEKIKIILQEIHALALDTDTTQLYKPLHSKMSVQNIIQAVIEQLELKSKERVDTFIKQANEKK